MRYDAMGDQALTMSWISTSATHAQIARPETLLATSPSSTDNVVDPRADGQTPRRKSVSSKSKAVVTIDQIRPDWEDKLNAVKAQAARRASRRIIMHRVCQQSGVRSRVRGTGRTG